MAHKNLHIEAVTVCVGYADFLAETEPINRVHFPRWLIVTSPDDEETRELCRVRNLECLVTRDFYRNGTAFDKAKGVDHALSQLAHSDWIMHLDADSALPGHFLESLTDADLNPECIHGFDRFSVQGWERWQRLKASDYFKRYSRGCHFYACFPNNFNAGARWADTIQGYVPIGFAQLWHGSATMIKGVRYRRYAPHGHQDAARTDTQFGLQWDRRQRVLVPEVIIAHLESMEGAPTGANWNGRTTPRFEAPKEQRRRHGHEHDHHKPDDPHHHCGPSSR